VGISGNVTNEVIKHSNIFKYRDVPMGVILRNHFSFPIVVDERVKCAAYASKTSSGLSRKSNAIYLQIGMGIGMGIIIGGEIYSGDGASSAGQIGHIILDEHGPMCHCGSRGCLEQFSSEAAIIRDVAAGIEGGKPSMICGMINGDMEALDGNVIVHAAEQGDALCLEVLQSACKHLAVGIHNLFLLFNPGKLIIKSNISENHELISSLLFNSLTQLSVSVFNWPGKIFFEDDKNTTLRGSAQIILDKAFETPNAFFAKDSLS